MSGQEVNFRALLDPGRGNKQDVTTQRHSLLGKKADLAVELHYGDFGTGAGREAALYLYRFRGPAGATGVFVPLSCLWMYVEGRAGNFNDSFDRMIPPLCETLYGMVTPAGMLNVMDAIIDYLDDLRKSPPDAAVFKDKSLSQFLKECDKEDMAFFVEVGGKRKYLN